MKSLYNILFNSIILCYEHLKVIVTSIQINKMIYYLHKCESPSVSL